MARTTLDGKHFTLVFKTHVERRASLCSTLHRLHLGLVHWLCLLVADRLVCGGMACVALMSVQAPPPVFYCTAFFLRVIWPLICPACHDCQWNSTNVNVKKVFPWPEPRPTSSERQNLFAIFQRFFPSWAVCIPGFSLPYFGFEVSVLPNSKGHGNARGRLGSARVVPLKRFSWDPGQTLVLESR